MGAESMPAESMPAKSMPAKSMGAEGASGLYVSGPGTRGPGPGKAAPLGSGLARNLVFPVQVQPLGDDGVRNVGSAFPESRVPVPGSRIFR